MEFEITAEQSQAFESEARRLYLARVARMVRESLPSWTGQMSDAELSDRVEKAAERARRYDVESERDLARFVGLSIVAGPEFDEIPEVNRFLRAPVRAGAPEPDPDIGDKLDYMLDGLASKFRDRDGN